MSDSHEALLDVLVTGRRQSRTIRCVIDTAYTSFLLIPKALVEDLDLSPAGRTVLLLADGMAKDVPVYSAWVNWLSQRRLLLVDATDGATALIGAHLLFPHRLRIDYTARTVEIS